MPSASAAAGAGDRRPRRAARGGGAAAGVPVSGGADDVRHGAGGLLLPRPARRLPGPHAIGRRPDAGAGGGGGARARAGGLALAGGDGYGWAAFVPTALIFAPIACGNSLFGLLNLRPLRLMGVVSYSVYLLHGIGLYLARPLLTRAMADGGAVLGVGGGPGGRDAAGQPADLPLGRAPADPLREAPAPRPPHRRRGGPAGGGALATLQPGRPMASRWRRKKARISASGCCGSFLTLWMMP